MLFNLRSMQLDKGNRPAFTIFWRPLYANHLHRVVIVCAVSFANAQSFVYFTFDPPDSTSITATGINNSGQIVGRYQDASGFHYFLRTGAVYTNIEAPGAS